MSGILYSIVLAYVAGCDVDNASGLVITKALVDKMNLHMKTCNSCSIVINALAAGFKMKVSE